MFERVVDLYLAKGLGGDRCICAGASVGAAKGADSVKDVVAERRIRDRWSHNGEWAGLVEVISGRDRSLLGA